MSGNPRTERPARAGALLVLLLLQATPPAPPINHVPRVVDSTFTRRSALCPAAGSGAWGLRPNDARRPVAELFGTISSVDVHQFGASFGSFPAVQLYLARLLAQRPRVSYSSVPWAEGTPLAAWGALGTVHFSAAADAHFEAVGPHRCLQESSGTGTWWRLAPIDVWGQH
jgi:hypothetical protein